MADVGSLRPLTPWWVWCAVGVTVVALVVGIVIACLAKPKEIEVLQSADGRFLNLGTAMMSPDGRTIYPLVLSGSPREFVRQKVNDQLYEITTRDDDGNVLSVQTSRTALMTPTQGSVFLSMGDGQALFRQGDMCASESWVGSERRQFGFVGDYVVWSHRPELLLHSSIAPEKIK